MAETNSDIIRTHELRSKYGKQSTKTLLFIIYTTKVADGEGGEAHMILWQHPGNDVTGMVGRCEKVAGTCDMLLEGETNARKKTAVCRVAEIRKHCPLEYVEMEPGDALFFHCNLLHCSSANTSGNRRWAFLCAYNRADNDPIKDHHHPHYTKLEKVGHV
ncbi:hypothetical protein MAR_033398 [Mya arenaria]|uniref:Phytanoyl-CoA dioxygenase n=1 Tax=Mya arenaria TaxID=6604 RepID=A0ABY7GD20_MYAAR|nr:hypothetical protein MAR_033398 [Mya arenaria]